MKKKMKKKMEKKMKKKESASLCVIFSPGCWVDEDGSRNGEAKSLARALDLHHRSRNHLFGFN